MLRTLLPATISVIALLAAPLAARPPQAAADERPATLVPPPPARDHDRRTVEIPMRDGVRLHTVILVPRGARGAPMLLTRTPYDAEEQTGYHHSGTLALALDGFDNPADVIVDGGYIRVVQDVRGKYGSQGIYRMNPAVAGTAQNPTRTDDSTDAYDTIAWLVAHVPETNGRVGMLGISYDGFTTLMALRHPHPALKVAVPINPMVDGWRGDDWFHNGAFRQNNMEYIWTQEATRDGSAKWLTDVDDEYDLYLRAGAAGTVATAHGLDQLGFWRKILAHPAYDGFWRDQAMDRVLAAEPLTVPTMLVHSLWDQEDIYGAPAVWRALKPRDAGGLLYLSIGPWYHGQAIEDGSKLGTVRFDADTAKWWRREVLAPFLAHWLKDAPMDVATVTAFQTGTNRWQRLPAWPAAAATTPLYLRPAGGLDFQPAAGPAATADYPSDPLHPVPYVERPDRQLSYTDDHWNAWLTTDQRHAASRPDVLSFTGPVLAAPVTLAGQPEVHLSAATSGTDSDWIVKLIDVYPDQVPGDRTLGGYQLAVAMDIFRGRYREDPGVAKPLRPDALLAYRWALPQVNHVFLPGHRIMVQVQSSWFPLYDRNPQGFVPSIFAARPEDYRATVQRVAVAGPDESYVSLPVVR